MKKRITALMLAALITITLAGCGGGRGVLTFNNAFSALSSETTGYKETDPPAGYKETLSYTAEYHAEGYNFTKDSSLSDRVNISASGTYTSSLEVMSVLPAGVVTDITIPGDAAVYYLTTNLILNVEYTFPGNEENNYTATDTITAEVYFLPFSESYMPLYSNTVSEYTNLNVSSASAFCSTVKSSAEVLYNSGSYTIRSRATEYRVSDAEQNLEDMELTENTYEYSTKTVIDNAQLIFATRNIELATESTYVLPVVSSGYGDPTDLLVANDQEYSRNDVNISYNDSAYTGAATLREMSFAVNSATTSGSNQYVYIIKEALKDGDNTVVPWIAAPYMIVSPMNAYGSFVRAGSLVCTLDSIEITGV